MVGRGPHRIWLAHPLSAGCDVMADLASTSSVVASVVCWSWSCCCWRVWFGARKMAEGVVRVGRRVGRWEKDLRLKVLVIYLSDWDVERLCGGVPRSCRVRGRGRAAREELGGRPPQGRLEQPRLEADAGHAGAGLRSVCSAGRATGFLAVLWCRDAPPPGRVGPKFWVRFGSEVALPSESFEGAVSWQGSIDSCQYSPEPTPPLATTFHNPRA